MSFIDKKKVRFPVRIKSSYFVSWYFPFKILISYHLKDVFLRNINLFLMYSYSAWVYFQNLLKNAALFGMC